MRKLTTAIAVLCVLSGPLSAGRSDTQNHRSARHAAPAGPIPPPRLAPSGPRTGSPPSKAMRDGAITMPPGGWADYCVRNPNDSGCKVALLDEPHWAQLQAIKRTLDTIREVEEPGSRDVWQVATTQGDCEDIALAGRQRLLAAGWPRSSVRLATAWTEQGDYHTLLTIDGVLDGQRDTWVIDSRFPEVMRWEDLAAMGYRFHSRQAPRGPAWLTIRS